MNNQQAIDRLVKHLEWGWSEKTVDAIDMGIHALKETQWIPCSEKLPEKEDYLIITIAYKGSTFSDVGRFMIDLEGHGEFYPEIGNFTPYSAIGAKVIAWRQLPEAYREETE